MKVPADAVADGGKAVVEYGRGGELPFWSPLTPSSVPVIPGEVDLTSQMCLGTWLQSATRLPASLGTHPPPLRPFLSPPSASQLALQQYPAQSHTSWCSHTHRGCDADMDATFNLCPNYKNSEAHNVVEPTSHELVSQCSGNITVNLPPRFSLGN